MLNSLVDTRRSLIRIKYNSINSSSPVPTRPSSIRSINMPNIRRKLRPLLTVSGAISINRTTLRPLSAALRSCRALRSTPFVRVSVDIANINSRTLFSKLNRLSITDTDAIDKTDKVAILLLHYFLPLSEITKIIEKNRNPSLSLAPRTTTAWYPSPSFPRKSH